jgi:hypothetical protein
MGVALAALAVAQPALGGGSERVTAGPSSSPSFAWSVSPGKLPEQRRAPGRLRLEYRANAPDGVHPPALKEAAFDFDRDIAFDLEGYPKCHPPPQAVDPPFDWSKCSDAVVGTGEAKIAIAFPESADVPAQSKVLVYKRRKDGGATDLFARIYITVPVPAAIVATIELKKVAGSRFGTEMSMTVPKIAGGSGSITSLVLHFGKGIGYKGTPRSVVSARCPDGHLEAAARMLFAAGNEAEEAASLPCVGRRSSSR